MDRNSKCTRIEDNGEKIITTSSERGILPIVWALKAPIPGDLLEENTESLKMFAMDEQDQLIDATALMDGYENYTYYEDLNLLIRKH